MPTRAKARVPRRYRSAKGWSASAPSDRQRILLADIPARGRFTCAAAWCRRGARNIIALPVLYEGQVKAVIELASLHEFTASHLAFLEQLTGSIGVVLNTIEATMRTEGLLQAVAAARRRTADAAEGAAADQRGAGHQGEAARRAERGGGAQERGNRAGPPRARGEGRPSSRSPRATSPSSSPTCRTSCARRSTAS